MHPFAFRHRGSFMLRRPARRSWGGSASRPPPTGPSALGVAAPPGAHAAPASPGARRGHAICAVALSRLGHAN
eukprot:9344759-Alexandrium_andersonii.AAC.1